MSASLTGDEPALSQRFIEPWAVAMASSPASRAIAASASRSSTRSLSCNGQSFDAHGRRVDAVFEFEIIGRRQAAEDIEQMAGDGDFAHRISALAVLDPETGSAAAVIAGDAVNA
jgi:hypothetical protein